MLAFLAFSRSASSPSFSSGTTTLTHSQLASYGVIDTKPTHSKSRLGQLSSIMDDELDEDTLQALAISMQEVLCLCARHWRASLQHHVVCFHDQDL